MFHKQWINRHSISPVQRKEVTISLSTKRPLVMIRGQFWSAALLAGGGEGKRLEERLRSWNFKWLKKKFGILSG